MYAHTQTHTPKCQPERKNCLKLYIVNRSKFAMPSNDFHLNNLNKLFPTKCSRILEASFEPQINGNVHSSDRNHFYCDLWTCLAVTSEGDFHYLWALNVYRDWKPGWKWLIGYYFGVLIAEKRFVPKVFPRNDERFKIEFGVTHCFPFSEKERTMPRLMVRSSFYFHFIISR